MKELIAVPSDGAAPAAIRAEEAAIGGVLSSAYRALLARWNGLDLEVIRRFGCEGGVIEQLRRMQPQALVGQKLICFGSEPSGFLFCEDHEGRVFSFDTDGGQLKKLADGFDDFIERVVFGRDGDQFSGEEWIDELRRAGLV